MRLNFKILAFLFVGFLLVTCLHFGDVIWQNKPLVFASGSALNSSPADGASEENYKIVIDPGHGGFDGGAVAKDGTVEKEINLAIALELRDVLMDYPVEAIMIRDKDVSLDTGEQATGNRKQQDLKKRKTIITESAADLTISIHLNSYPSDVSVYGAQVFYPKKEQKRTAEDSCEQVSKTYAENVQKSLETNIQDGRERVAMAKGDTYLLKNIDTPFILIECGFLSNVNECDKLKRADYQRLMAEAIWEGINTSLRLEKKQKIQIIQSANKE